MNHQPNQPGERLSMNKKEQETFKYTIQRPRTVRRLFLTGALAVILILALGLWWRESGRLDLKDAKLLGRVASIQPPMDGRVAQVAVIKGQEVRAGDLIFRLDEQPVLDVLAKVLEAKTRIEAQLPPEAFMRSTSPYDGMSEMELRRLVTERETEERSARDAVGEASISLAQARLAVGRFSGRPPRTPEEKEAQVEARVRQSDAELIMKVAEDDHTHKSLARAEAEAALKARLTPGRKVTDPMVQALWAEYQSLRQVEQDAQTALKNLELRAPLNGVVESITVQEGQLVKAGGVYALVASTAPSDHKVYASIGEKDKDRVKAGQECLIRLRNGTELRGVVEDILPNIPPAEQIQPAPEPVKTRQEPYLVQIGLPDYTPTGKESSAIPVEATVFLRRFTD